MSRYKRLPHATEKGARDEFVSFVDQAAHFIGAHKRYFLAAVVIAFTAWLGYIVLERHRESNLASLALSMHEANLAGDKAAFEKILQSQKGKQAQIARLPLIQAYAKEGNAESALKEIDASLGKVPAFVEAQLRISKAQILWDQSKFDDALSAIKPLSEGDESAAGSYPKFLKAQILEDMGKKEEAVKIYEELSQPTAKDALMKEWATNRLVLNRVEIPPVANIPNP